MRAGELFIPDAISAIRLSIVVGVVSVLLSMPLALPLGWLLARKSFRGKALLSTILLAPLVMPPVVTGLLLLRLFGRFSLFGRLLASVGIVVPFSLAGAVVAAGVVGFPLFVLSVRTAFEVVDTGFEDVALSLGMPPLRALRRVTLPLAMPGIAAGAVLAFARALGEFGATAVLSGNIEGKTRTIALAVYTLLDVPDGDTQMGTLLYASLGLSFAALIGFEALTRWQRRRLEA